MALIGTISGSVGAGNALVSATAISGTLVVADSPASVFPTLPTDVKFFVSGVQGAIVASRPGVAVFGGDLRVSGSSYFTDIDVTGHGAVIVQPYGTSTGQTGEVRFKELAANGGNYTALKSADSVSANLTLTLPAVDGASGNILKTSGTGITSFVDASSVVTGALSLVSINASGDITGSNALVNGDLAVNGGDITTPEASLNISAGANGLVFQRSGTPFLSFTSSSIGSYPGLINLATIQPSSDKALIVAGGLGRQVVVSGSSVELGTSTDGVSFSLGLVGLSQNYLTITSGSYTASGSTATNVAKIVPGDLPQPHDLLIGASSAKTLYLSGTSIVANTSLRGLSLQQDGASYGVLQGVSGSSFTVGSGNGITNLRLISSGNVAVVLDVDNSTPGHTFQVLDNTGSIRFKVSEDNAVEVGGTLFVTGSTTLSSSITMATTIERLSPSVGGTGTVTFDLSQLGIFYVNAPTGDITANFTNVPTTNNRVLTPTIILSQSAASTWKISNVQIDSTLQPLKWANGVSPVGTAGKQDVYGFSLIRSGSNWNVLGQLSTYG